MQKEGSLICLEIGSGDNPTPGYIHSDIGLYGRTHLEVVCTGEYLPFKNEVLDKIYMQGVFEHFTKEGSERLLKECNRTLKLNGTVELTCPDLVSICKIILTGWLPFNEQKEDWNYDPVYTREENILNCALRSLYGWNRFIGDRHQWAWTKDSLQKELENRGFDILSFDTNVYRPNTHLHFKARKICTRI